MNRWIEDAPVDRGRVDQCSVCGALVMPAVLRGVDMRKVHEALCQGNQGPKECTIDGHEPHCGGCCVEEHLRVCGERDHAREEALWVQSKLKEERETSIARVLRHVTERDDAKAEIERLKYQLSFFKAFESASDLFKSGRRQGFEEGRDAAIGWVEENWPDNGIQGLCALQPPEPPSAEAEVGLGELLLRSLPDEIAAHIPLHQAQASARGIATVVAPKLTSALENAMDRLEKQACRMSDLINERNTLQAKVGLLQTLIDGLDRKYSQPYEPIGWGASEAKRLMTAYHDAPTLDEKGEPLTTMDDWMAVCFEIERIIAERAPDGLKRERAEASFADDLIIKLSGLLTRTANALKGDPGPLKMHSHHDLPEVAQKLKADCGLFANQVLALNNAVVHCEHEHIPDLERLQREKDEHYAYLDDPDTQRARLAAARVEGFEEAIDVAASLARFIGHSGDGVPEAWYSAARTIEDAIQARRPGMDPITPHVGSLENRIARALYATLCQNQKSALEEWDAKQTWGQFDGHFNRARAIIRIAGLDSEPGDTVEKIMAMTDEQIKAVCAANPMAGDVEALTAQLAIQKGIVAAKNATCERLVADINRVELKLADVQDARDAASAELKRLRELEARVILRPCSDCGVEYAQLGVESNLSCPSCRIARSRTEPS